MRPRFAMEITNQKNNASIGNYAPQVSGQGVDVAAVSNTDNAAKTTAGRGDVSEPSDTKWVTRSGREARKQHESSRNLWVSIAPKTTEGKIVFASSVAQAASMVVAPLAVIAVERLAKPELYKVADYIGKILTKHIDRIDPIISRPWRASLSAERLTQWDKGDNKFKGNYLAKVITNLALQGTFNIGVTMATRMMLDKKLEIKAGSAAVARSQMIDTAVAMGAMIGLPALFPAQMRNARTSLRDWLEQKPGFKKLAGKDAPRQYALNTVNFGLADMLGFTAGTWAMMRAVEKNNSQQENKGHRR